MQSPTLCAPDLLMKVDRFFANQQPQRYFATATLVVTTPKSVFNTAM